MSRHCFFCVAIFLSSLSLSLSLSLSVSAAETGWNDFRLEAQKGDIYKPQGLWPLLGVGLGTMDNNGSTRTGGVPSHVKVLGSYYFADAPMVTDAGLGLHNEFLTQPGSGSDAIQSLYSEVAGRYIFNNRWQLGAIWNTLIDNPHRYQSNNDNLASFLGAQVLKELTWKDEYLVRVGGRAMTSVGLNGGSVNMILAELEVSFGNGKGSAPLVIQEKKPEPIAPHLAEHAMQSFRLETGLMHFESNSTHLVQSSNQYIKRLAQALADNHQLFERVMVIGHTDQRGSTSYNYKLSQRRAMAIADKLVAAGVKTSQVMEQGKGKTALLTHSTTPAALLRNRRVQLEFQGVKNQMALKNVIDSANR